MTWFPLISVPVLQTIIDAMDAITHYEGRCDRMVHLRRLLSGKGHSMDEGEGLCRQWRAWNDNDDPYF
jgi:hypothetical protein